MEHLRSSETSWVDGGSHVGQFYFYNQNYHETYVTKKLHCVTLESLSWNVHGWTVSQVDDDTTPHNSCALQLRNNDE